MTRILGVDPGTRVLGYGAVVRHANNRGLRFEYLECGVVRTPTGADMVERLGVIGRTLTEIIEELRPDELALEKAVPAAYKLHAHHWLILHGRYTCIARKPACERCIVNDLCHWPEKTTV